MFTLSDKYKALGAAIVGLVMVLLSYKIKDPTLLAAIGTVLSALVVYAVPNRPS